MAKLSEEEAKRAAMIARECRGIYRPYEAFYLHSVQFAAQRSEAGFAAFWSALSEDDGADSVFAAIQDALGHAAALSRFFWPTPQAGTLGQARGERLRYAFELADDAALSSRAFRNAVEHLDERLDRFLLRDPVGYFFPGALIADHTIGDDQTAHVFKLVDPERCICMLLGEKFDFAPVEREVRQVHRLAQKYMSEGSVLPE